MFLISGSLINGIHTHAKFHGEVQDEPTQGFQGVFNILTRK